MYDTYKYRNIFFKTGVSIAEKEEGLPLRINK